MKEVNFDALSDQEPVEEYWPEEDTWFRLIHQSSGLLRVTGHTEQCHGTLEYEPETGNIFYTASTLDTGDVVLVAELGTIIKHLVLTRAIRSPAEAQFLLSEYRDSLPDPADYTWFEQTAPIQQRWNNEWQFTRTIVCTAFELVLDTGRALLERMNEREDIAKLTLIADTILVRTPVRLPSTQLRLLARRLVFEHEGRFDTSAAENLWPAPLSTDGQPGGPGGDITVAVQHVEFSGAARVRFVSHGARGQDGGPGQAGPNGIQMETFLPTVQNVTVLGTWRLLPTDMPWLSWNLQDLDQQSKDLLSRAVYVQYWHQLTAQTPKPFGDIYVAGVHPYDGKAKEWLSGQWPGDKNPKSWPQPWPDEVKKALLVRLRPGQGGAGGDGGFVRFRAGLPDVAPRSVRERLCAFRPGEPGMNGARTDAKASGRIPASPLQVKLIFEQGFLEINDSARVEILMELPAQEQIDPADPPAAQGGRAGRAVSSHQYWLHPLLLARILAHCQDLWRAGRATEAERIARLYLDVIEQGSIDPPVVVDDFESARLLASNLRHLAAIAKSPVERQAHTLAADRLVATHRLDQQEDEPEALPDSLIGELRGLHSQILAGLDAFGMPAGWVPALSFTVTLDTYKKVLQECIPSLVCAQWIMSRYGELSTSSRAIGGSVQALTKKRLDLAQAFENALKAFRKNQEKITLQLAPKQRQLEEELDKERTELLQRAIAHENRRAAIQATFRTIGAVLQLIPYAQPALGAVGKGMDALVSDDGKSIESLETLVGSTASSVFTNQAEGLEAAAKRRNQAETELTQQRRKEEDRNIAQQREMEAEVVKRQTEAETSREALLEWHRKRREIARSKDYRNEAERRKAMLAVDRAREGAKLNAERDLAERERAKTHAEQDRATLASRALEDQERTKNASQREEAASEFSTQVKLVAGNVGSAVTQFRKGLQQLRVPREAIAKRLAELEMFSPQFQRLVAQVKESRAEAAVCAAACEGALLQMNASLTALSQVNEAINQLNRARDGVLQALRPSLWTYFQTLERQMLADLQRFQYYLVKAYEYRFVQPCTRANYRLDLLHRDVEDLVRAVAIAKLDEDVPEALRLPADRMERVYTNQLQSITQDIARGMQTRRGTTDASVSVELTQEQLRQFNETGRLALHLVEDGILPAMAENVRMHFIGITELSVEAVPESLTNVNIWFVHSGDSRLRFQDAAYAFRTVPDPAENSGRVWQTSCTVTGNDIAITNHQIALEELDLIRALLGRTSLNDQQTSARWAYVSPAAWAEITMLREITPVGRELRLRKLILQVGYTSMHAGEAPTLELAGVPGSQPFFAVSPSDRNRRSNGRGFVWRIWEPNTIITVSASRSIGQRSFEKWIIYHRDSLQTSELPARRIKLTMNASLRAVAHYR